MNNCEQVGLRRRVRTPKTEAGKRIIPLWTAAVHVLETWRQQVETPEPDGLVFSTRTGGSISPNNVLRRMVVPACAAAGVPHASWLTFRRTYSSWAHDKGVPGKVVAQLMAHANVDVTLNTYTQVLDGSLRAAVDAISTEVRQRLAPIRAGQADVTSGLRHSAHGLRSGPGHRIRGALVVAQVALCFVLLFAAGLFVRSALHAERADLGFRANDVLNVHMDVGQLGYRDEQGRAFFDEIQRQVRSLPGVENASLAFTIPMGYIWLRERVEAEGQPADTDGPLAAGKNIVSPEYFETMGIGIVRGRPFTAADGRPSRPVAIVNERLAEALWPGRDPIGRRFRSGPNGPWLEVVGVTATGIYRFLFEEPQPYFYVPSAQEYTSLRVLQVRTSIAPESLGPAVERVIRAREPDLPVYDVQSMTRALGGGLALFPVRVAAIAAAAFSLLALTLALVGLYGVVSYVASQRAHEIGVRIAVGATARDIVRLVLRDGVGLVLVGLAAGVVIALAGARVVGALLFGVSARDPLIFATVTPVLGGVALLACAIPAWRAARIEPAVTLRAE